jgi:hypothetical protein
MRTSHLVRAVNWRHAVGELILIVLGILIALAISDWNDQRIQRSEELALLAEVRSSLAADLETLEQDLAGAREGIDRIEMLIQVLTTRPPYRPEMDSLFGAVYGIRVTNLNTLAYETLKSIGLQHISDPMLRQRLVRIYDHYYERIIGANQVETGVNLDLMRPYFLQHFRDLKFSSSATPMDYAAVIADPWFRNMVEYRLTVLRGNVLDFYPEVIGEIRAMLETLDRELGKQPA